MDNKPQTTQSKKINLQKFAWRVCMSGAASMYETTFKTFPAALRWIGKNKTERDISIQIFHDTGVKMG